MRRTKKSLTKKIRFEVFKRDSFKCQYERREQLEMMLEWRSGMKEIEGLQVEKAAALWSAVAAEWLQSSVGA